MAVPVLAFVAALSLLVLYLTFVPDLPTNPGYTLRHWAVIARPNVLTTVLPNTAIVGAGTTVIAVLFGVPLAWLLYRTSIPLSQLWATLLAVSVVVPGFVRAMGWTMLLNEKIGLINQVLALLLRRDSVPLTASSLYGTSLVMGLMLAPVMFFLLAGPFRSLDPALEEAASLCGASRWFALRRISLPLVWPGILSGAIYVFVTAISIFEVPALLGGLGSQMPLLATELFYDIRPASQTSLDIQYGVAGVYAVLMAAPSLLALSFYHRLLADSRQYEVVTGRGYQAHLTQLGRLRYVGLGFVLLYLLLAVILPLAVLLWVSFLPVIQMPSGAALAKMTLANYTRILPQIGGVDAIRNSVVLMLTVALLTVVCSFMISWVVVRTPLRGRFALDSLAMLPHAVPPIAYAFALYMVALTASAKLSWLPLSGSLALIVIAHTITRLPYGTRMLNTALVQVHRELEEVARVSGAGPLLAMRRVVIPLVRPTILLAATWTALLSLTELTMALFLGETDNRVLSSAIWNIWSRGQLPIAAAAAVALVAVTGVCVVPLIAAAGRGQRTTATVVPSGTASTS